MRSLRLRLWLSYVAVIVLSVIFLAAGFVLVVQRSPLFYRQTAMNLQVSSHLVLAELQDEQLASLPALDSFIADRAGRYQVALAVLLDQATVLVQYGFDGLPPQTRLLTQLQRSDEEGRVMAFRDANHRLWFFTFVHINDRYTLLAAAPRPHLSLIALLRQGFEPALIAAGLVALALALAASILIANWIAAPLQHITTAAQGLAAGRFQRIEPEGPDDVRRLAITFNEMSNQVQASQKSQQDFIANVSHELKTPLTSIQGFAQAILDDAAATPEDLKRAATVIYEEAARMHRMVLDLLSLTRLESGLAEFDFGQVNLGLLLQSVLERFAFQVKSKDILVECEIDPALVCHGDGDRLGQVFSNLVDNAIKFSPPGGTITIHADKKGEWIEVKIQDQGPGIPLEERSRIFERFYQLDKARDKKDGAGVGLGLAIAEHIIRLHHGTIEAQAAPGGGAAFIVNLQSEPRSRKR